MIHIHDLCVEQVAGILAQLRFSPTLLSCALAICEFTASYNVSWISLT
jgi:hypothetical protein